MMIGVRRIEHDGNPRVGGFERRDYARSGETRGETRGNMSRIRPVSYTHLRAHET